MNRKLARIFMTLAILIGIVAIPFSVSAFNQGHLLVDFGGSINAEYPRVAQLSNGTILAEEAGTIYKSTNNGDTFSYVTAIPSPSGENSCCGDLFAFPQQLGGFGTDTLLYAYTIMNDSNQSLKIYRSTDNGASWQYHSTPITSSPTWEPELAVDSSGNLVLFYSDERNQGGNQIIAHIVSTDGGLTWGSPVTDVQIVGARPGMPRVAKLGTGSYMMIYEICGSSYNCTLYYRNSTNGTNWGTASSTGTMLQSTDGHYVTNTTFIAWSPEAGNANGMVIVGGMRTRDSGGNITAPLLFVNHNNGSGSWYNSYTPFDIVNGGGPNGDRANYSSDLLPLNNGAKLFMIASSYVSADNRTKMFYDTKTWGTEYGGQLLSNNGFENGVDSWSSNATMQSVSSPVASGGGAAFMTGRTADWNGIQQTIYSTLNANGKGKYLVQANLRSGSGGTVGRVELSLKVNGTWISSPGITATITDTGYTTLSGIVDIDWSGTLEDAVFKVNTVGSTTNLYVDDCTFAKVFYLPTASGSQVLNNGGFESGTSGWSSNASFSGVSTPVNSGGGAAYMTGRTADWNGIQQQIYSNLNSSGPGSYLVEAYVRTSSSSSIGRIELALLPSGGSWTSAGGLTATISGSGYTKISGIVNINWSGTLSDAVFKINTVGSTENIYVDDCRLIKL